MNISHSFSVGVAKKYDVNIALLLQHFTFWYLKNKADDNQFFKGDYWVRMKVKTLHEYFPYFTTDQLRRYVEKMVDLGLIKKGEFNQKKNDRTKWYTLTNSAKKMVNISTGEIANNVVGKFATPTGEFANSIYKEEDIEYRYNIYKEKIEKNLGLLEIIAMQNRVKISTVKNKIEEFVKRTESIGKKYNNDTDLFTHFESWIRKQNLKDVDIENEITWFIEVFNKISKREFVVTDELRKSFAVQLANGFTGKQMAKAVENMYSSDVRNAFHLKHSFKFATPEYLMKEGNLNKYLNLKY